MNNLYNLEYQRKCEIHTKILVKKFENVVITKGKHCVVIATFLKILFNFVASFMEVVDSNQYN